MKSLNVLVVVASIAFIAGAGLTYVAKTPWVSDMANQASIKPQEGPILPPQGSVPTNMLGATSTSPGEMSGIEHQHSSGVMGHQQDRGSAGHDHGLKPGAKEMGHQHGASAAAGHNHDDAGAKHDHTKDSSPTKTKPSQRLPTDLLGSAGTGPGKTLPAPQKNGGKDAGAHDHSSHSHGGDDHGAASKGQQSGNEKNKTKAQSAPHQHSHGGTGHGHGAEGDHAGGHNMQQAMMANPVKPTEASIKTGNKLFNIYCAVCHGNEGRGGAPMANKLAGIPKFTPELLKNVDDNHMFSMVTSGHGPMPGYGEALTPEERWHVTNYVRTLPIKLAGEKTVSTRQEGSR